MCFLVQVHSEVIATYALCGFSNFASLGMSIGALCECHFMSKANEHLNPWASYFLEISQILIATLIYNIHHTFCHIALRGVRNLTFCLTQVGGSA